MKFWSIKLIKITFLSFCLLIIYAAKNYGQTLQIKRVELNRLGSITVPKSLDTLGQSIIKKELFEKNLEAYSKNNAEKKNKIDLAKAFMQLTSKNSFFFWPQNTIFNLLTDSAISKLARYENIDFEIFPNLLVTVTEGKVNSKDLKKVTDTSKHLTKRILDQTSEFYLSTTKTIFPNVIIDSFSSKLIALDKIYPTIKMTSKLSTVIDGITTSINELNYFIYKDYSLIMVRFDYKTSDYNKYSDYISHLLNTIKLF